MSFISDYLFLKHSSFWYISWKKNSTAICTKNLAWKFYPFCTHNTVRGSLYVRHIENEISHEDDESRPRELCLALCFYGNFIFFPEVKCIPEKKLENSKVDFCMNWQQIDDRLCGPILTVGTESIDQSVTQFAQRWASGTAIPENCAFARFCSPRLFIEAMQFTDNGLHTLVEKKGTRA